MKRVLTAILLCVAFCVKAQVKVSQMPTYQGNVDSAMIPIVINGYNYKAFGHQFRGQGGSGGLNLPIGTNTRQSLFWNGTGYIPRVIDWSDVYSKPNADAGNTGLLTWPDWRRFDTAYWKGISGGSYSNGVLTLQSKDGSGFQIDGFPTLGQGGAVNWSDITGKPNTVMGYGIMDAAQTGHTHTFSEIMTKPNTLSGYGIMDAAPLSHVHDFTSITSKPTTLSGYGITDGLTRAAADALYAGASHAHSFASISGKPTTIGGYGITDAYTKAEADGKYSLSGHVHPFSSITSKPTTLAGYGITDAVSRYENTYLNNGAGTGDSLFVKVNDSTYTFRRVRLNAGSNVSISKTQNGDEVAYTINAAVPEQQPVQTSNSDREILFTRTFSSKDTVVVDFRPYRAAGIFDEFEIRLVDFQFNNSWQNFGTRMLKKDSTSFSAFPTAYKFGHHDAAGGSGSREEDYMELFYATESFSTPYTAIPGAQLAGVLTVSNPLESTGRVKVFGKVAYDDVNGKTFPKDFAGGLRQATPVDALQFFCKQNGTFSGKIKVIGIKKQK